MSRDYYVLLLVLTVMIASVPVRTGNSLQLEKNNKTRPFVVHNNA